MSDATAEAVIEEPTEAEVKARDMGWRPEEEWEGDKSGWMDADTFVDRQDKRRAVANEEFKTANQKLEGELAALRAEHAETRQTIEDFKGWQTKAEERLYKKAIRDVQARQRTAVEAGDTEAFDAASQEIGEIVQEAKAPVTPRPKNPDEIPAYKAWHARNSWYNTDLRLTKEANQLGPEINRLFGLTPEQPEFYEKITEQLKEDFPDKFENPNRKRANAVEDAPGGKGKTGKTAASLPKEVRETGERFVKEGLFKDINAYAKAYLELED